MVKLADVKLSVASKNLTAGFDIQIYEIGMT